jgi:TolB-like protein/Flp pilus assembly protein TadD
MPSDVNGYRFGGFTLLPKDRQLLKGSAEVVLRPKAFDTLRCLVERHGHAVARNDLLDTVWPDTNVSEAVLTHCITEIRQALEDDVRRPRFVKTVSRHGYTFVAEVVACGAAGTEAGATRTTSAGTEAGVTGTAAPPASAIVVLPFANLSGDPDNEFLCDGLSEELINALTKVGGLQVVAHSSSFSFKGRDIDAREIGRQLHVGSILEGSVRKTGDRLRVSAQLIDAARGYHVWCEQYDRTLEDIFAIQDEISQAILASLKGAFLGDVRLPLVKPSTASVDAYVLYLQGRAYWHQRYGGYLERAMECFGRAIARDPGFALAYTGLADSLASLGIWGVSPAREVFPKAATLANTALDLDLGLAEAHASRALIRLFWDWEWDEAEHGFLRALALNPGCALIRLWYGHYLSIVGRLDEAIGEMRRAQVLDPLSPVCAANLGFTHYLAHQQASAIDELERVLAQNPHNGLALFYLGWPLIETGRYDEAIVALEKAHEVTHGLPWSIEGAAMAHGLAGRRDKASQMLDQARIRARSQPVPTTAIALIQLGLGDTDGVLASLERAVDERDALLPWMKFMPCFDHLHGHPRFQAVLGRLGLAKHV